MLFSHYDRYQYAVNPLVEVICQLRFPAILSIGAKEPAEFQEAVRREFPRYAANQEVPAPTVKG
ncbi:MAG TPA: TIGR04255 family protein, partial [Pseudoflavonifractor sp.]|nr:TIGR04255 family protein [Pseudoflavonifractor sp.]